MTKARHKDRHRRGSGRGSGSLAPQAALRQAGKDARLKHILMRGDSLPAPSSQLTARSSQLVALVGHETFVGVINATQGASSKTSEATHTTL